jgi:hypothetical protein
LTYGTAYFDLEADPALFELAVRALAEGKAIIEVTEAATGTPATTDAWVRLSRAGGGGGPAASLVRPFFSPRVKSLGAGSERT